MIVLSLKKLRADCEENSLRSWEKGGPAAVDSIPRQNYLNNRILCAFVSLPIPAMWGESGASVGDSTAFKWPKEFQFSRIEMPPYTLSTRAVVDDNARLCKAYEKS